MYLTFFSEEHYKTSVIDMRWKSQDDDDDVHSELLKSCILKLRKQ